ncbi:MAG: methionyl-tRNA formyltransferase [Acidobacteria bacterium]|nr:MAG: methionyl-tRNA formyltransferase [Acidobacteriota bacterium]
MRIVFFGTPDFALPSLRSMLQAGHEIVSVVSQPDRPRRRQSSTPEPSPVKAEAQRAGLPVLTPESTKDPGFFETLLKLAPEVMVVVAYGRILPPEILRIPPRWCINLHASLLPKYRGAAPIARAIMAGEKVTGVTTIKMDQGLDTGDILLQRECAIGLDETAGELARRLADLGAGLLAQTLESHARGVLEPRKQDAAEASPAPSLTRADGRIDWSRNAQEIANQVRGCHPWPLAVTFLRDRPVTVHRAEVSFEPMAARAPRPAPGQVIAARDSIIVQCQGDSRLRILQVQFPGRKTMTAREAVNGRLIRVGETFAQAPPGL